ncbi:hypothetical protein BGZ76_006640 [Entomortierella beljakovae]|nr:hypothetical protein BGZ76_006640 [Entomortierella beljakovae]
MSQQQKLVKHFLSLTIQNSQHNSISTQKVKCLYQRSILVRYSTDSKVSVDKLAPATTRNIPKPDTRRGPERTRDRRKDNNGYKDLEQNHKKFLASRQHISPYSEPILNPRTSRRWSEGEDRQIIELFNSGTPWKEIDYQLDRPLSSCYNRYYSALDPNLRVWNLPNGQPNTELIKRLVYLVDVEKQSFSNIDKQNLMQEPWETPTPYAPPEVLLAYGAKAKKYVPKKQPQVHNTRYGPLRPFNKLSLQKKYNDHKAHLAKNSILLSKTLLHRAIRRGAEIYGENWRMIATHADMLLDLWTPTKAANPNDLMKRDVKTKDELESGTEGSRLPVVEEREALYPNKVASIYRILQRKGVNWGLEDDAVMTRKILSFYQKDPSVLDILAKPFGGSVDSQEVKDLQRFYWSEISVALGSHSPTQCKRRWDGLWDIQDQEKSAHSKSWHRFERFNFWMIWSHFYQMCATNGTFRNSSMEDLYDLSGHDSIERICQDFSFSNDVSKWMRHRSVAQCEKYFKSSIKSALRQNAALDSNNQGQVQATEGTPDYAAQSDMTNSISNNIVKSYTGKSVLDAIRTQVAMPILEKISTINPRLEESTRGDRQQQIVRPDWTRERIKALYDIVMQKKQGVLRADFDIDWDEIASSLENMPSTGSQEVKGGHSDSAGHISNSLKTTDSHQTSTYITGEHCHDVWDYLSSGTAAEARSTLNLQAQSILDTKPSASQEDDVLSGWTDHELQLLQQGVRKFGNSWADVRAQFLPNRTITELYQTWLSVTAPSEDDTAGTLSRSELDRASILLSHEERLASLKVDRLSEPDYVGLLSAVDKVGGMRKSEE